MFSKHQLLLALAITFITLLCQQEILAEVPDNNDNAISSLYENLLQREYAGPVVFPNHQVERKAQRSPSLRLRFGRRTDPDMMPAAEKRWFGDVNQKPIRSPSLRLRFGRRSDPSMPLHSKFDALLNDLVEENAMAEDYNDIYDGYERVVRKPQRLRWGRSVPYESEGNSYDEEYDQSQQQREDDFFNSLMHSEKLRNMLLSLRQYDVASAAANANADESTEFQREVRKPAPLRLRWGRSTGGRSSSSTTSTETAAAKTQEKKKISSNAVNTDKTQNAHEQHNN